MFTMVYHKDEIGSLDNIALGRGSTPHVSVFVLPCNLVAPSLPLSLLAF